MARGQHGGLGRPNYLGPVGPSVVVNFSAHAVGRMIERVARYFPKMRWLGADDFECLSPTEQEEWFHMAIEDGLPYQEIVSCIRQPNAGESDEVSSASYGSGGETRYMRHFRPPGLGRRKHCMVVFVVEEPMSTGVPGTIHVVTFLPIRDR